MNCGQNVVIARLVIEIDHTPRVSAHVEELVKARPSKVNIFLRLGTLLKYGVKLVPKFRVLHGSECNEVVCRALSRIAISLAYISSPAHAIVMRRKIGAADVITRILKLLGRKSALSEKAAGVIQY